MVPVYVPATAAAGMVITIVGFHAVLIVVTRPLDEKAVCGVVRLSAFSAVAWPGTGVCRPVVEVATPDQYEIELAGIVCPPGVAKAVVDTVAVKEGRRTPAIPVAVTVTTPSCPDSEVEPEATEPRTIDDGTVIETDALAGAEVASKNADAMPTRPPKRRPTPKPRSDPVVTQTPDCQTPKGLAVWPASGVVATPRSG